MKNVLRQVKKIGILVFAGMLWAMSGLAQEQQDSYYIEGDKVVFVFDIRNYAKALLGENALKVDFADLGIYEVAVSGEFNDWNKKGWKMTRVNEFVFNLEKKILDFNDAFPIEFRYIINSRYIADPDGVVTDARQFQDNFLEDVYKVDLSVIKIVEQGNVLFSLEGYGDASEVILAGTFNGWNEHAIKMNKVKGGWALHAELPAGRYEYKFIVDGKWIHDPANKDHVRNEHETLNSVLLISTPVTFSLKGYAEANTVVLTGSFCDWNEKKLMMVRDGDSWRLSINLSGGKHTYKFIVDGKWITDPNNPIVEDDGEGNKNSVRFVH